MPKAIEKITTDDLKGVIQILRKAILIIVNIIF